MSSTFLPSEVPHKMQLTFLWLHKWLWYNQLMQKNRTAFAPIILLLLITGGFAFWLGQQSVQPLRVDSATNSNAPTADQTDVPALDQSSNPEATDSDNLSDTQNTDSGESAQQIALSAEQERLLADIELAGIEPNDLKVYLKAWELLNRDFYGEKPDATMQLYSSIRGLLESYNEPYTFFIEPQTYQREQEDLRGSFGGIGAYIEPSDLGPVLRPMRDQPAANAGIEENDLLVQVDDKKVLPETPIDDVTNWIRGDIDTYVELTVKRFSEAVTDTISTETSLSNTLAFTITRAKIQTPSMDWEMLSADDFSETLWSEPQALGRIDQIGYIRHHTFSDRSPEEMRTALDELAQSGAAYFILDLRGNPGGPVTAVVKTVDLWIDGGDIMREVNAQGEEQIFVATNDVAIGDVPLLIIVDGGSASASEILAGALSDQNRATLLGEQTFGKGSVQIIYPLPDDSSVHITNATWFTPSGDEINGQGLQPDIAIEAGSDPLPQAIGALLDLEWNSTPKDTTP